MNCFLNSILNYLSLREYYLEVTICIVNDNRYVESRAKIE